MTTPLLIGLTLLLLVLTAFWAMARTRRIREAAQRREEEALARVRAGAPPLSLDGETVFEAAGLPSRLPERRGIEVAEHDEVVDLEALLAGEPQGVAHRARATLEEPTNISLDLDTLPPRPAAPPAPVVSAPTPALAPAPPPASPVLQSLSSMHPPSQAYATAMASQVAPARPAPSRAQPSPPTLVARLPGDAERCMAPPAMPPAAAEPRPVPSPAPLPAGGGATIRRGNDDVPLRELALAWFEARGYRSAPASSAVRPIEQVLRHRHDPARAYAFVVESSRLSAERVQQLRNQARAIGLLRVLIVADAGAEEGAATKSKGVRVMDRASLAAEFDQLDFSVAAKIIAVARKRSGVPITVH
jgi:hypothetical protein